MIDQDQVLLESTRTHRHRVAAALVHGSLEDRRSVGTNVRRFVGSVVLAAVACVGCVGFAFVMDVLQDRREHGAVESLRAAMAASPLTEADGRVTDPATGFLREEATGRLVDPRTGFEVDEETGYVRDPDGQLVDSRTGWFVDPATGNLTDPGTGVTVDPRTLRVVEDDR